VAVWRSLPDAILQRIADLLNLVEREGHWPQEVVHAFVTMIPKASGGTRPHDQRPITVLDILYRLWAKGIVLTWRPTLQTVYLGTAAMGFRAQVGQLHLAQLLSDVMVLQKRRQSPLWLASFDVERCFPSLPWWAVFGVLTHIGVNSGVVQCFRSFYQQLRQRFRYGHSQGAEWQVTNGLAQGCPASPDLLNVLFEAFHRWAAASGKGVPFYHTFLSSASFADDVVLMGTSWAELEFLIQGYLEWCRLLGLRVKLPKTQLWTSEGDGLPVDFVDGVTLVALQTRATFKIVGVELGLHEATATKAHATPRLQKASLSAQRLGSLPLPAAVVAQIWRSKVLAQALYGCELRHIPAAQLRSLRVQGRKAIAHKPQLGISTYGANEVLFGLPLGACAARDPTLEALERQLKWVVALANTPSLVGLLHRHLSLPPGATQWADSTPALAAALASIGCL